MRLPQDIIRHKRDGHALSNSDIDAFIAGIAEQQVCDEQIAAMTMAICIHGMNAEEQARLTQAMTHSGEVLDWAGLNLPGPIVDKHSTGGVGDKVSLMLAPIVAACGGFVPMISGRGLGHTAGTLDKLDCIPGYNSTPDLATFQRITQEVGCSIIGQTSNLAPADKRIYAVRDISGTVESIPLITASILSKKLAAGLDALVMDVKFGNGAFMDSQEKASELAQNIIRVAAAAGLPTTALVTDMNQVLGHTVGHSLEVLESILFLTGQQQDSRLLDCTLSLAAEMLYLSKLADSVDDARAQAKAALDSGRAAEKFQQMVSAYGGPTDCVEKPQQHLSFTPIQYPVYPHQEGFIAGIDTRAVGQLLVSMGGGRIRVDQSIDPAVGISDMAGIGSEVNAHQPLATIHANERAQAEAYAQQLLDCITISTDVVKATGSVVAEQHRGR